VVTEWGQDPRASFLRLR